MDDWPPWKTKPENSHSGRILELARCIYDFHYRPEPHAVEGASRTFDNMCGGDLEKAASVLARCEFTRFIDKIGRRSVFICCPSDFKKIAFGESARRVDVQVVCDAVFRLAEGGYRSSEEIDYLAGLIRTSDDLS